MIADSCYQWGYGTRFWSMYYYTTTCNSGADICMYRARAFIRVMKHLDYYYYKFLRFFGASRPCTILFYIQGRKLLRDTFSLAGFLSVN